MTFKILLNGSPDFKPTEVISFVEQDDALYGVLTVRETVAFAARLSCVPILIYQPKRNLTPQTALISKDFLEILPGSRNTSTTR